MSEKIRVLEDNDFEQLKSLFIGIDYKTESELRWVFRDPNDSHKYNAFVAIDGQNIIKAVIGFSLNNYVFNEKEIKGVIFSSWMKKEDYHGFSGISLLKKVSNMGDFAFAIRGSKEGQKFYSMLKYQYVDEISLFYKVLDTKKYYHSLKKSNYIKKLGMFLKLLPSSFPIFRKNRAYDEIEMTPYDYTNYGKEPIYHNVFKRKKMKNYVDWLLDCPLLESYAFVLKNEDSILGTCVLYVKEDKGFRKGRIIYLPFLGYDIEIWNKVIKSILDFFKKQKCCVVDGLSLNSSNQRSYKELGFIELERHSKPLFIKDQNNFVGSLDLTRDWNIQYSIGDKGYRNF